MNLMDLELERAWKYQARALHGYLSSGSGSVRVVKTFCSGPTGLGINLALNELSLKQSKLKIYLGLQYD